MVVVATLVAQWIYSLHLWIMKKFKLYLETSVWNFLISEDVPQEREITNKLFQEIGLGRYEVYISELVYAEIEKAPIEIKRKLEQVLKKYPAINLKSNKLIEELAEKYIHEKIVPPKYNADVIHIAFATVFGMDVIVSWNLKHLVKLTTKLKVNGINKKEGFKEIEICTPQEVID